jgi:hypothetical protein
MLGESPTSKIKNVKYQNITVEDAQMLGDDRNDGENDFLIDFTIAYNIDWSHASERGSVDGITIENIRGKTPVSDLMKYRVIMIISGIIAIPDSHSRVFPRFSELRRRLFTDDFSPRMRRQIKATDRAIVPIIFTAAEKSVSVHNGIILQKTMSKINSIIFI